LQEPLYTNFEQSYFLDAGLFVKVDLS